MAKQFGYCSSGCTRPQFEKQIESINHNYPKAIIVKEIYSNTEPDRTELNKLLSQLERDDTVIIYSMDRLSRDPEKLSSCYMDLMDRGVSLVFINQPYMNTEVYLSAYENMVSQAAATEQESIRAGLKQLLEDQITRILEKSRGDLQLQRSRMRESYRHAKAEEKKTGRMPGKRYESRKSFLVKELIKKYNRNYHGYMNDVQTMEQIRNETGTLSRNTYYKYKKEIAEDET